MSWKIMILIVCAGGFGTLLRCLAVKIIPAGLLPWGTLAVNGIGCFLAGVSFVLLRERFPSFEPYAPLVLIGFLGALTTFSTFALESANLFLAGAYGRAVLNLLAQNGVGLAAVFCGFCAARMV